MFRASGRHDCRTNPAAQPREHPPMAEIPTLPGVIGRFVPRITVRRPPHSARLSGGLLRERLVTSPTVRDLVFHRLWRHCARRVTAPRRVCAYADVTGGQQRTGEHRMARHGLGNHFLHRRNSSRSTSRPIERQGGSAAQKRAIVKSGVRRVVHAAALLSSMSSIPSLNRTPWMTFASCRNPRSRRQDFSAHRPIL